MLLKTDLVQQSCKRLNFDLGKLVEQVQKRTREQWMTAEQKERRYRTLLSDTESPELARAQLERIINGNDLVSINYLERGLAASRAVCRIQLRSARGNLVGYGTGFLIGPGVLMTNEHVFEREQDAATALLDFAYELDRDGRERTPLQFALEPQRLFAAVKDLDFAISAVSPQSIDNLRGLSEFGWLPLSAEPGKGDVGEYLSIIQHPGGERKQVCVRENRLLRYVGDKVWYQTDTVAGSSGSPVFNNFWQIVALHHSGVPKMDAQGRWLTVDGGVWDSSMDESRVAWIANEGFRISRIVADLRSRFPDHPLVRPILDGAAPPNEESSRSQPRPNRDANNANPRNGCWAELDGDSAALVVPIRIPIEVVRMAQAKMPADGGPMPAGTVAAPLLVPAIDASVVEKVEINQDNYDERPGYAPNFLGSGNLKVPLPKVPRALQSSMLTFEDDNNKKTSVLTYWNYSVVMNKRRRLAFFSCVNIDGKLRRDVGKREGDTWYFDTRIDKKFQLGNEFYKTQKLIEKREENPFDRGHLVRRLDGTWGATVAEAKEHGDDTFHFTNCAPQVWKFNQGAKLWLGLEEYVLDSLEEDERKACVMNGPVFDAPRSDGEPHPDPKGARKADPKFNGISIPKLFWKLFVVRAGNKLRASAFLLSQEELLDAIPRIEEKLSDKEAKVFQVNIKDLTSLTGLDFGALAYVDTKEAAAAPIRRLESLSDIRL